MSKANQYLEHVSLRNNDDGVSPVVGTILMVAVTVILAAVIAAFIFGFSGAMPVAPNVSYFSVERNAANGQITITNMAPTIANVSNIAIYIGASEDPLAITDTVEGQITGDGKATDFSRLTTTYGALSVMPGKDGAGNTITGGYSFLNQGPTRITIRASVNGAAQQVIETVTV